VNRLTKSSSYLFSSIDLRDPQEQRRVGLGAHRDPVVGLGGGWVVLGSDRHDLPAPLHDLVEPVRLRHLVLHQVLPDLDSQQRVAEVVEVDVRRLEAVDEREPRGLVAVPGVVRPVPAAQGLLRIHPSDLRVEEGHHVGEPVDAVLAEDPEEPHATAELHGAGPGAAHGLDHLRLVALVGQALRALVAGVVLRRGDEGASHVPGHLVPGHSDEGVGAARGEPVPVPELGREVGVAVVRPLLPPLADHGVLEAVGSVHPTVERVALGAAPGVPVGRGRVAEQIRVPRDVVVGLGPHDHPVADESPEPAGMGVVRRADVGEGVVVVILVAVHALPVAVRVGFQGVRDRHRDEPPEGEPGLPQDEHPCRCAAGDLQEVAARDPIHPVRNLPGAADPQTRSVSPGLRACLGRTSPPRRALGPRPTPSMLKNVRCWARRRCRRRRG